MKNNQHNGRVGDVKSPPLQASEHGLRIGSDQAKYIKAQIAGQAAKSSPLGTLATSLIAFGSSKTAPTTCKQVLWLSFFFDGTGNNQLVDEGMKKHSNVAKLFGAHKPEDKDNGVYALYIPGVGTYFPEIGDDGGNRLGLGCGAMGEKRLNHALQRFDEFLRSHLARAAAPSSPIVEINISAFGFSRGAALARAFINMVLDERCSPSGGKWTLRNGGWPLRIRFLGLFDTVASVGLPLSTNTTSMAGTIAESARYMIHARLRDYDETTPDSLAFSERAVPGADPAPGKYNGHDGWGGRLKIDEAVEEVRHFVAAHEMRNSFPLDSVSISRQGRISKPAHFHETVYPGVHSDVGGSYCAGEGGKGNLHTEKLGLIPLRHMYKYAIQKGVPLLPELDWDTKNKEDFAVDRRLLAAYDYYSQRIAPSSSLGELVNQHMALYFAWRFRAIRMKEKGDRSEAERVSFHHQSFEKREAVIKAEIEELAKKKESASRELDSAIGRLAAVSQSRASTAQTSSAILHQEVKDAREKKRQCHHELLQAKARLDSLPQMDELQAMLEMYDRQLLADARAIRDVCTKQGLFGQAPEISKRKELRPHYKALVEAYENEYEKNQGLTDEIIIRFFDHYVHDSLAGFAKDATLPSDPRVVYLGGDEKYRFASLDNESAQRVELGLA